MYFLLKYERVLTQFIHSDDSSFYRRGPAYFNEHLSKYSIMVVTINIPMTVTISTNLETKSF